MITIDWKEDEYGGFVGTVDRPWTFAAEKTELYFRIARRPNY